MTNELNGPALQYSWREVLVGEAHLKIITSCKITHFGKVMVDLTLVATRFGSYLPPQKKRSSLVGWAG